MTENQNKELLDLYRKLFQAQEELKEEINKLTLKLNTATNSLESYKLRTEDTDKKR